MTPAQQSALQTLKGSDLTADEITALGPLVDARNDAGVATLLSANRQVFATNEIGVGTVLATLAPNGGTFLDTLTQAGQSDSNVKWAMVLINASHLDIGMAATRAQMQALAQAVPGLASGVDAILALAMVVPLSYNAVSDALNALEVA